MEVQQVTTRLNSLYFLSSFCTFPNLRDFVCFPFSSIFNPLFVFFVGAIASTVLNPISVIRMQCWSHHTTFNQEVRALWRGRGMANFSKGLTATVVRDLVFGGMYASSRHNDLFGYLDHSSHNYSQQFIWNGISALLATTVSSPFNYIRNIQLSTPHEMKPKNIFRVSSEIIRGFRQTRGMKAKFDYLQIRFKFGWATLRVGLGMALSSQAYEYCVRNIPPF